MGRGNGRKAPGVKLTDQQQAVVDAPGDFLLLACPGSGKTRSASERVARLTRTPGVKVAVCSFTNVGADRLSAVLRDELRVVLGPEHFIGTIHGFLIRFVLAPFGHRIKGGPPHPIIRTDDDWPEIRVHGDNKQRVKLNAFHRAPDGALVLPQVPRGVQGTPADVIASVGKRVLELKRGLFLKHGHLTADDAMWAALSILRNRPDIAKAVAARFDELLLDEAQDTSGLQLECVRLLHQTMSLRSLVLVGDLEQSIYSFQGASAAGCRQLADTCGLREMELTENHRSSQLICDVAVHFCAREQPDRAVGPHKDCEITPELVIYPHKTPAAAVEVFRTQLSAYEIDPGSATVLTRRRSIVNQINGVVAPKGISQRHASIGELAAAAASGTLSRRHVAIAQQLVAGSAWDLRLHELDEQQREAARAAGHTLLLHLPPVTGTVQQFISQARTALGTAVATVVSTPERTAKQFLPAGQSLASFDASMVFSPPPRDLTARTVHSFKGEDSDAVMVVVRRFSRTDPTEQMTLFRAVATGDLLAPEKEEERRVMFVALTRASRYCLVALPDDKHGREVAEHCADLGFRIVGA